MAEPDIMSGAAGDLAANVIDELGTPVALCNSGDLQDSQEAVPFDVVYQGQTCRGFAVRFEGEAQAYLNRCAHIPMEMDYQPNRFFDSSGQWLICATHGAMYHPGTGDCVGGPCNGGLVKIKVQERQGVVHWLSNARFKPVEF